MHMANLNNELIITTGNLKTKGADMTNASKLQDAICHFLGITRLSHPLYTSTKPVLKDSREGENLNMFVLLEFLPSI